MTWAVLVALCACGPVVLWSCGSVIVLSSWCVWCVYVSYVSYVSFEWCMKSLQSEFSLSLGCGGGGKVGLVYAYNPWNRGINSLWHYTIWISFECSCHFMHDSLFTFSGRVLCGQFDSFGSGFGGPACDNPWKARLKDKSRDIRTMHNQLTPCNPPQLYVFFSVEGITLLLWRSEVEIFAFSRQVTKTAWNRQIQGNASQATQMFRRK